jgi:hypothetical protein
VGGCGGWVLVWACGTGSVAAKPGGGPVRPDLFGAVEAAGARVAGMMVAVTTVGVVMCAVGVVVA